MYPGFWRLLVDHFTHNNQPKIDAHNGGEYGQDVQPGSRGGQSVIATCRGIKIWLEVKTKIKLLSWVIIIFSWSDYKMILNLAAPPLINPFRWCSRDGAAGNPIAMPLNQWLAPSWWCCFLDGRNCDNLLSSLFICFLDGQRCSRPFKCIIPMLGKLR